MKTLYDKLKPEYKQKLDEQAVEYPSIVKNLTSTLKDNYFWSHLTVGQAKDLITFTDYSFAEMSTTTLRLAKSFLYAKTNIRYVLR